LLTLAKEIVASASEATRQALNDLRFDSEWLDTSTDEATWPSYWYMIVLARELIPAPSLSNRSRLSWAVLESFLSQEGWHESQIELLVRGRKLRTLVESSGNPLIVAEFTGINQYGGWLDLDEIGRLYSRLLTVRRDQLVSSIPAGLAQLASLCSQDPIEMFDKAHADVTEMFETAIARDQALFVILD
jgi:hypothetical protein